MIKDYKESKIAIGSKVYIKGNWSKTNIYAGEWGVVDGYDGNRYHVRIWDGEDAMVFDEDELEIAQ